MNSTCLLAYFTGLFLLHLANANAGERMPDGPLPNWSVHTDQIDASFGWSVATAGDVNGDGFDDVIVGTPSYDFDSGKVFAYYGSASGLSITPDWTAETNIFGDELGLSVGTAGDVNGDGYDDVIVAAPADEHDGRVFVFHGSASGLSVEPNWMAVGDGPGFGYSVRTAGDVNGDGFDDVIVGSNVSPRGEAFVYIGSVSGLSLTPDWTDEGDEFDSGFGIAVGTAGDVNGDGFDDVIVGAWADDNDQPSEGKAFAYHGSASGLSLTPDWMAEGNQDYGLFGESVASAGDVNGDGYDDVIVGAPAQEVFEDGVGRALVYHGSPSGLSITPNWTVESDQDFALFGTSVATAGDVNGDGYDEVIIGAYAYDHPEDFEGRAFVYSGSASGLSLKPNWIVESDQRSAELGVSAATAGDVNDDGYGDVIVGAPAYDSPPDWYGGIALGFYGPLTCQASLQVQDDVHAPGRTLIVQVHLAHNRPETVTVPWELRLFDASGQRIVRQTTEPHTFEPGDVVDRDVQFRLPDDLASGTYTLELAISGMAGTKGATTTFRVVSAE